MALNRIQHRRSVSPAGAWPPSLMAGELAVNPVRRTAAVGDTDGTVRELVSVPFFDTRAVYSVGDLMVRTSIIYQCSTGTGPGAFNPAHWTAVSQKLDELQTTFDGRYALIGHNHDGVYSPVGHNHNTLYAAINHNHDGTYAALNHNHDATYAKLSGATFGGSCNFMAPVNFQGSYVAVFGALSVANGAGGFVPFQALVARSGGQTQVYAQSLAAQQVRFAMNNPNREVILYLEGDGSHASIYDISGNRNMLKLPVNAGLFAEFTNPIYSNQYIVSQGSVVAGGNGSNFDMRSDANSRYFHFAAGSYMRYGYAGDGHWELVTGGGSKVSVTGTTMTWNPAGHAWLIDGIFHFRTFPTAGLPSAAVYSPTWVSRTSAPGDWAATNDGATWQLMHFV